MTRVEHHVHTSASYDCRAEPSEILDRAEAAGIDVLCVTDHDTLEGAARLQARAGRALRVVVGCEFTCEDRSHVIGLGLRELVRERRLLPLLEAIREQGAAVVLPHPFRRGSGVFRPELRRAPAFVDEILRRADLVECWNARDTFENNQRSLALVRSRGLAAVAGSDAHAAAEVGRAWVEHDGAFEPRRAPARVYHPRQAPRREHPLRRGLLELYHRHEGRLPAAVATAYRRLRRASRADAPGSGGAPPILQLEQREPDGPGRRSGGGYR